MRLLLFKTSSLGDVIHTLPAVTDALRARPGLEIDWVVEEGFAEIPRLHPGVHGVIPIALRRWRRAWIDSLQSGEIGAFRRHLGGQRYDLILDAQGLAKSALISRLARGERVGMDRASAREPWVASLYDRRIAVPRDLHAIERLRRLFAAALGYEMPEGPPDYGIGLKGRGQATETPYLILLHGTTWPTKFWPDRYWIELARLARAGGYELRLPWGNAEEEGRAKRIVANAGCGVLLPRLDLKGLARELAGAAGVVGVDSGLAHLAAALGTPGVTLYGPTRTELTGAVGPGQRNLQAEFPCAPCLKRHCSYKGPREVEPACFASLPPAMAWAALLEQIEACAEAQSRQGAVTE